MQSISEIELYEIESGNSKGAAFYLEAVMYIVLIGLCILSTAVRERRNYTPKIETAWIYRAFDLQAAKNLKQNEDIAILNFLRVIGSPLVISYHVDVMALINDWFLCLSLSNYDDFRVYCP